MIDTLEAVFSDTETDPSVASVNLQNISFDGELLSEPRYPTLFNHDSAPPDLDLVPSFRVRDENIKSVKVTLQLAQDFEFRNSWRLISGNAEVTAAFTLKSCVLTIIPGTSPVVLQIPCKRVNQMDFSILEETEGGLFLSLVKDARLATMPGRKGMPPPVVPEMIFLMGADDHERLQYNIFADTVYTDPSLMISAGLEPEPAFRVRQGKMLNAKISLARTDLLFLPVDPDPKVNLGRISLEMRQPTTKPEDLSVTYLIDGIILHPDASGIQWARSGAPSQDYRVISFCMAIYQMTLKAQQLLASLKADESFSRQLSGKEARDEKFGQELLRRLSTLLAQDPEFLSTLPVVGRVDPTIIDTPTCTVINGHEVCSGGV